MRISKPGGVSSGSSARSQSAALFSWQPARPLQPGPDTFTADEYESVAKEYEAEGRDDMAEIARQKAVKLKETSVNEKTAGKAEFERAWNQNLMQVVEENPDLKDANTELYKVTAEIINRRPQLKGYADGIKDAVEHAKMALRARELDATKIRLQEQEKQIAELNKKLAPSSGEPGGSAGGEKSFDEMTDKEQENFLRRITAAHDRNHGLFEPVS